MVECRNSFCGTADELNEKDWQVLEPLTEQDDECDFCSSRKGVNYDTGEIICNHSCLYR